MLIQGRVALVQPPLAVGSAQYVTPPLGLLVVGSALRAAGLTSVSMIDLKLEMAEGVLAPNVIEQSVHRLAESSADTFAFSVQCVDLPIVIAISRRLKEIRPDCRIVVGGHDAALLGDRLKEAFPCIDVVVVGAIEQELKMPYVPWLTPAYDLAPSFHRYAGVSKQPTGLVEVARGCPYDCAFCSIPLAFGRRLSYKPVSAVITEMRALCDMGCETIHLVADTLTINRHYIHGLLNSIRESELAVAWTGMTRADLVDPLLLADMADAGCCGLLIGLESASTNSLQSIDKHAGRYPDLIELTEWFVNAAINPTYYFLINLPSDSAEGIEQTLCTAARMSFIDPGSCRFQLPRLSPGTRLTSDAKLATAKMDPNAPYAQFLAETVGEEDDTWEMIEAHPSIFSTYFRVDGPIPHRTALSIAWLGSAAFSQYPLTLVAFSEERSLLSVFEQLANSWEYEPFQWADIPTASLIHQMVMASGELVRRAYILDCSRQDMRDHLFDSFADSLRLWARTNDTLSEVLMESN